MKKTDKKTLQGRLPLDPRGRRLHVEAGENDNLIVQKLEANPDAFGVFGFSFLDQNADKVQGSIVEGRRRLSSRRSPPAEVSGVAVAVLLREEGPRRRRSRHRRNMSPSSRTEKAFGPDGYLIDKGLIPLPDADR